MSICHAQGRGFRSGLRQLIFLNWLSLDKNGGINTRKLIHATSTFGVGDVSHCLSQWTPDLLVSEGPNGSSAGEPVCDQWRSQEVGIIEVDETYSLYK